MCEAWPWSARMRPPCNLVAGRSVALDIAQPAAAPRLQWRRVERVWWRSGGCGERHSGISCCIGARAPTCVHLPCCFGEQCKERCNLSMIH